LAYYVYLLASRKYGTLYLGVTNDLVRRVYQHKNKIIRGFTSRYGVDRLVGYECYDDPITAITTNLDSSFRGAGEAREPGIHNLRRWLWIPGPALRAVPE
jgi:hypothetical protein